MACIWGVPYFFIRVAVEDLSPPVVVFGRTSIASVALWVVAIRARAIRPALLHWRPVVAFAILEMAIPWILLTHAETHVASGLTSLIIASVPVAGTMAALTLGDRSVLRLARVTGIVLGLGGVALLVVRDLSSDTAPPWWSIAEVLTVVVCYATAPFLADRHLADVPSLGVIAVSLTVVGLIYAPIAAASLPDTAPPAKAVWSVVGLAVICTGLAFVVFFRLMAEVGPSRAGLITFANPVVAIALGAVFLDEVITIFTVAGFVLVICGCVLAMRPAKASVVVAATG
jgi:drug/metabolite transporter (DMT)-like permease